MIYQIYNDDDVKVRKCLAPLKHRLQSTNYLLDQLVNSLSSNSHSTFSFLLPNNPLENTKSEKKQSILKGTQMHYE